MNTEQFIQKVEDDLWVNDTKDKFYYKFKVNDKVYEGEFDYSKKPWNNSIKLSVARAALSKLKVQHKQVTILNHFTLDRYVKEIFKLTSIASLVQMRYYENGVKQKLGDKDISIITPENIKELFDNMREQRDFKLSTFRITFDFLNLIFDAAYKKNIIKLNPCEALNIEFIRENEYIKSVKDKIHEIYNVISVVFKDDPLSQSFFLFLLNGKKMKKILTLRWEYIDFENNSYRLNPKKYKSHYLHPAIKEELLKVRKKSGLIYENDFDIETPILSVEEQSFKVNEYIPDFNIEILEFLVEELHERQTYGESYSTYDSSKRQKPQQKPTQKLITKPTKVRPNLNIGKFSKKT